MPKMAIPKQIIFDDETFWLVKSVAVESSPGVTDFSATLRRIVREWAAMRQAGEGKAPLDPGGGRRETGR